MQFWLPSKGIKLLNSYLVSPVSRLPWEEELWIVVFKATSSLVLFVVRSFVATVQGFGATSTVSNISDKK